MTATFTWKIEQCVRETATGAIVEAFWRCTASETVDSLDFGSSCYGGQRLSADPTSADFIDYENVTEADVLSWLWADSVVQGEIEASLQAAIDDQKAPETAKGLPWTS